jgi:hypothetical protein
MVELFIVRRFELNFLYGFFETQIIVREGYRSNLNDFTGCVVDLDRYNLSSHPVCGLIDGDG